MAQVDYREIKDPKNPNISVILPDFAIEHIEALIQQNQITQRGGKPMTNYNERLDDVLAKHGAEPGEMTHSLKQAILRWVADEVIGEDDTGIITDPDSVDYGQPYSNVYVDRDEQRKILAQHGYKGANQ